MKNEPLQLPEFLPLGVRLGRVVIGPEGAFFGNVNFNSQRAGAFIKFPLGKRLDVTAAGGLNFVANDEIFKGIGSGEFGGLGASPIVATGASRFPHGSDHCWHDGSFTEL